MQFYKQIIQNYKQIRKLKQIRNNSKLSIYLLNNLKCEDWQDLQYIIKIFRKLQFNIRKKDTHLCTRQFNVSFILFVLEYKTLSDKLGYKLFQCTQKSKKQTNMMIMSKCSSIGIRQSSSKDQFLCRKNRRSTLGIQEADIENYQNKRLGKCHSVAKRKIKSANRKKKDFQVSESVKGKFNIKGFAAKIDHNLGRRKGDGFKFLTKMINIDLLKH